MAALILGPRHRCEAGCCCRDLQELPLIMAELNGSRTAHWNLIQFIRDSLGSWMRHELWKRGVRTEDTEDCQEDILMRWILEDLSKAHEPAAFGSFLLFKIRDAAREYRKRAHRETPDFAELIEEVFRNCDGCSAIASIVLSTATAKRSPSSGRMSSYQLRACRKSAAASGIQTMGSFTLF